MTESCSRAASPAAASAAPCWITRRLLAPLALFPSRSLGRTITLKPCRSCHDVATGSPSLIQAPWTAGQGRSLVSPDKLPAHPNSARIADNAYLVETVVLTR